MNECLEFNVELCFVLPLEHLCNKKKDLKGYCGIYHNPAANGQQTHGGKLHSVISYNSCDVKFCIHLQCAVAEELCISSTLHV